MAVGIIIGAAFNKIVNSLANDSIMPPIGLVLGGVEFKDLQLVLREVRRLSTGEERPLVAIRYGMFVAPGKTGGCSPKSITTPDAR